VVPRTILVARRSFRIGGRKDGPMPLSFVLDPPLTDALRADIVALWADVTNAGGAVGFVAPVTEDQVRPLAEATLAGVAQGIDRLLIGVDDGRLVALLFIADNRFPLKAHWRVLKRVMVLPGSQGRGYGAALMREAAAVASELQLAALQVTVRDGHGLDGFYRRLGYREVGRIPGALRVGPGDDRDELVMWLELPQPQDAAFTAGSAAASATSPA
jgi:GNAT superfamily N-acetyltransferase